MNTTRNPSRKDDIWNRIESEKKKDQFFRRVSIGGWIATILVVLCFATIIIMRIQHIMEATAPGHQFHPLNPNSPSSMIMPLITVVGGLALLIAIMGTIGMFLRMRTSSLNEMQMRLAALEELIISGREKDREDTD